MLVVPFDLKPPQIAPYRLENRRTAGSFRVFDVLQHDVIDESSVPAKKLADVYTFSCRDWCNVVAKTPEGELVFIWQYRFGTQAMELEVPGGVIEPGEAPEVAAARELREESGYVAERLESLGSVAPNPALQGNTCHFFLAHGARKTAATAFDEHESIEVTLVPQTAVADLIEAGHVRHSLAVIALERALRKLGGSPPR